MISSVQLICLVGVVCMAWAVAGGPAGLAGLNPERAAAYSGTHYTCDGGAVKLPASRLNDDYCDCGDGSDEPGTAACAGAAGGRFYCPNVGHRATEIPSALVNDGVCDCCDGSDEWEKGGCQQDGCMEQFRRQREAWRELIQLHTAGAQIREAWEQQAEQELRALREAGVQLKEELGRAEEELAKAEERQREEREQRALERERDEPPLSLHNRIDDDTDEGDTQEIDPKLIAHLSPIDDDFDAFDAPSLVPETGDEDEEEIDGPEVAAARGRVRELKGRLEEVEQATGRSYGPKDVLYGMLRQQYEIVAEGYTYKARLFESVTQDRTDLGSFKEVRTRSEDDFSMAFADGSRCWNGPARSTELLFSCGLANALKTVEEVAKCTYQIRMETPAACSRAVAEATRLQLLSETNAVRASLLEAGLEIGAIIY